MAIGNLKKVMIAGHHTEFDMLIKELQFSSIIHIDKISEQPQANITRIDSSLLKGLEEVDHFLERFRVGKSFWEKLLSTPSTIERGYYESILDITDPDIFIAKAGDIKERLNHLESEKERALEENKNLDKWKDVTVPMNEIGYHGSALYITGRLDNKKINDIRVLDGVEIQVLSRNKNKSTILAVSHRDNGQDVLVKLKATGFEEVDASGIKESPSLRIEINKNRITEINIEIMGILAEIDKLLLDYDKLTILLEYYNNSNSRSRVLDLVLSTQNAFVIVGWIKTEDLDRFKEIISLFKTVLFEEAAIDKGENPPVVLDNKRLFSPFQSITKLYSFPSYGTLDPSPVLSIFFVVFLGLTITDAGYGIILSIFALFGLWKFKSGRDFLWIIFWGGVFTIIAGLITGGIFGDLFRLEKPFVNIPFMNEFREWALVFDPMKDPMVFLRLVLLLGLVHIITGLLLGFISSIKQGHVIGAISDNLAWIGILFSLLAIFFSSRMSVEMAMVTSREPIFSKAVLLPSYTVLIIMSILVILFGAREEDTLFFRIFIGFLKLLVLSGIFSYLGDLLSYIRLMALGMVTAGIGMAINTIAFMIYDVPFVGIFFTVVVLIIGHVFNLCINLLGGFVHTLRLQYVEFFSKFFVGGGREFLPLSNSGKYVKIE